MASFGFTGERAIDSPSLRVEVRPLFRLVYLWMGFGLLLTTFVSILTARTPALQNLLIENPALIIVAFVAQLGLVIGLSAGIRRFSANTAAVLFCLYSGLTGFTLSLIFLIYPIGSIVTAFVTTTALFGVMTVVGYTTQVDLTKYRTYFMMGLIGLFIAMVVNMFLASGPFDLLISIVGVVLFTALTAYHTQKIKQLAADPTIQADSNLTLKMAILGALTLYLDFINLFLFLLRLMGGRRA
jgi:uncharacterized protein